VTGTSWSAVRGTRPRSDFGRFAVAFNIKRGTAVRTITEYGTPRNVFTAVGCLHKSAADVSPCPINRPPPGCSEFINEFTGGANATNTPVIAREFRSNDVIIRVLTRYTVRRAPSFSNLAAITPTPAHVPFVINIRRHCDGIDTRARALSPRRGCPCTKTYRPECRLGFRRNDLIRSRGNFVTARGSIVPSKRTDHWDGGGEGRGRRTRLR